MNPEKHINENEQLEKEEQAIGESILKEYTIPSGTPLAMALLDNFDAQKQLLEIIQKVKKDTIETLNNLSEQETFNKLQENADSELADLKEEYNA